MVEGDKWEMYIPYHLAYGEHGKPPKIPAKATLIFIMELVNVLRAQRSCTVHDVLHCAAIRTGSFSQRPRMDHSTQLASRSIFNPTCFSHASHSLRHVESMKAGLREHSPC